jgi:carboxypeptidase C (cathepsin A)
MSDNSNASSSGPTKAAGEAAPNSSPSASQIGEQTSDRIVERQGSVTIAGQQISYTSRTGEYVLREEQSNDNKYQGAKARAKMFVTAYTRNEVADNSQRPIIFAFNGGPGSASVWLHLGLLGPQRAVLDGPAGVQENPYSLLDVADLVFIDPISTGYSRAVEGENPKDYHGYGKDLESVAALIALYIGREQRWRSPKYILGESYGTTRACGLVDHLQERYGMAIDGVVLISCAMDFQTLRFDVGNDLPYALILPSQAATAWYHNALTAKRFQGRDPETLENLLKEAEEFAAGDYSRALFAGASLPEREQVRIAKRLSELTSISVTFIERCNLRVSLARFCKQLLRDFGQTVGRLDSRFTGLDRDRAGEVYEYDPTMSMIQGVYTAAMNDYLRRGLGYEADIPYEVSARLYMDWDFKEFKGRYVNVADSLRKAMSTNPKLRVLVQSGVYDLATPYFASDYTMNHFSFESAVRERFVNKRYLAGHMMYVHQPSLVAQRQDLLDFLAAPAPKAAQ